MISLLGEKKMKAGKPRTGIGSDREGGFVFFEPLFTMVIAGFLIIQSLLFFRAIAGQMQGLMEELQPDCRILYAVKRIRQHLSRAEAGGWTILEGTYSLNTEPEYRNSPLPAGTVFSLKLAYRRDGAECVLTIKGDRSGMLITDDADGIERLYAGISSFEVLKNGAQFKALKVGFLDSKGLYCTMVLPCGRSPGGFFL